MTNNTFNNGSSGTYPYSMYLYYGGAGSEISGNEITIDPQYGGYGMILYYMQGNSSNPVEVYNNIINFPDANDAAYQYGMYMYYSYYVNAHHNTINLTNTYSSTTGLYGYATSTAYNCSFKNNIVNVANTTSRAYYGYSYGIDFDNNVWNQGGNNGQMNLWDAGTTYTNFSDWASATGQSNSVYANPDFVSSSDLTPQSPDANDIGTPLGITTDIYGYSRSLTTPDAGAIEFSVPTNNAGITDLITPDAPLCSDDTAVVAVLKNTGLVPLTSCTITYALNGSVVTNMAFSGSLAVGADTTITVVSNTSFSSGDEIAVWSSMPNGVADSSYNNDTASVQVFQGLSGTYGVPSDYATLTAAASDIMLKGLCDDVTISITPGVYNEQVMLGSILGSGPDATLTWTSSTGDPDDVRIKSAAGHTVTLDGTEYVTFSDLTIQHNNNSSGAQSAVMINGANMVTLDGNRIIGTAYQGYAYTGRAISAENGTDNLTITNNVIEKGSYAGVWVYASSSNASENLVIENNTIKNCYYYYPVYMYYADGVEFNYNTVTADTNVYYYNYGVYLYYSNDFNVMNNYIGSDGWYSNSSQKVGYRYGLYVYQSVGSSNPRSVIANNCINSGSVGTSYAYSYYATYMGYSGFINFHNNSLNRRNGYTTSTSYSALSVYQGGLIDIKNNSLMDLTGGSSNAMYIWGQFAVSESDHNNFHSEGNSLIRLDNSTYSSLEDYQSASGNDMNSISTNPMWEDTLACVTCNDTLADGGTPDVSVTTDINDQPRSVSTPDIGAVEWVNPATFTLGGDSTYCADEVIVEAGPAQSVTWSVNGNSYTTPSITLTGGNEATTYNVLVSIQTLYCGSASDNALITLVPNAMLDSNTHLCADESTVLNPGGLASGTYSWSNGATTQSINVTEPGVYTVTKNVMGCESQATSVVTQSQAVEIIGTDVCSDDLPLQLDATIQNGTSYAWSGGSTPGTATNSFTDGGPYSVTVSDAFGCTSVDSFEIVVLEEPEAVISVPNYSGNIYIFDASSSNYFTSSSSVSWNFGVGAVPATSTNVMETVSYPWSNPSSPASYSVSLEINNGCGVDIATTVITPDPLGVEDLESGEFALFPNPADDMVTVMTNGIESGAIIILDMSGRTVAQTAIESGANNHEINVSGLTAGAYLVKVMSDNASEMKQLIIQ